MTYDVVQKYLKEDHAVRDDIEDANIMHVT